jgi:hypothetical protein
MHRDVRLRIKERECGRVTDGPEELRGYLASESESEPNGLAPHPIL